MMFSRFSWRSWTTLQKALLISFLFHGALLTLRVAAPERFDRLFSDTPLEVILVNTRAKADAPEKAQALAQEFSDTVCAFDWRERHDALAGTALLVNTTNQGMYGQPALDIDLTQLPTAALVSDAIYIPLETSLLEAARLHGNTTVNGLGMLLHQARPAFHAWFGVMPEVTPELCSAIITTL